MYKKKFLAVAASTAMLTTLTLAGTALATDRVEVKVTSEPIASGSSCDKAGGFSLEFDTSTTLLDGDQITIDTAYNNATNYSALCRDIDLVIAPGSGANISSQEDGGNAAGGGFQDLAIQGIDSPVTEVADTSTHTENGVVFHVAGNAGSQRLTFDIVGIDTAAGAPNAATASLSVGSGADDKIIVRFLDQDVTFAQDGIFTDNNTSTDDTYDKPAILEDNTLCIDVSNWAESTVNANMDSKADKFTFIPSNPQIAHVVSPATYALYECSKAECGSLSLGSAAVQGSSGSCGAFDNENPGAVGTAYMNSSCSTVDDHENNQLIIQKTNGAFDLVDYIIDVSILVNGVAGENGVYFTNDTIAADGASTESAACAFTDASGVAIASSATTYYLGSGSAATPVAADTDCTIAATAKAVRLVTNGNNLSLSASDDFLYINLPQMHYDLSEVEDGDQVSVEVTVTKAPCGEVTTVTQCVGTFLGSCPTSASSNTLTFPYFSATGGDNFWDGIAVTNTSSSAGTMSITMYEQDGDTATATGISVAANSMYVNTLATMISDGTFTAGSGNSGTIGDSRAYLVVTTDFSASGFAMIANSTSGESMGYTVP